jgi:hypothetical protein
MDHFYSRDAFYLACMAAGVVLMLLFYFRSGRAEVTHRVSKAVELGLWPSDSKLVLA